MTTHIRAVDVLAKELAGFRVPEQRTMGLRPQAPVVLKHTTTKLFRDYHDLIERVERKGYKRLGNGSYSTVLAKEGRKDCIKIGTDSTWEPYIHWATKRGYAGTFAPRVYEFHQHNNDIFTARMERLTVTLYKAKEDDLSSTLSKACYGTLPDAYEERFPGLCEFTTSCRAAGFTGDWSGSNWMLHEGRLVLIDPQSGNRGSGARRWKARDTEIVTR